jgi:hypothetical protein
VGDQPFIERFEYRFIGDRPADSESHGLRTTEPADRRIAAPVSERRHCDYPPRGALSRLGDPSLLVGPKPL